VPDVIFVKLGFQFGVTKVSQIPMLITAQIKHTSMHTSNWNSGFKNIRSTTDKQKHSTEIVSPNQTSVKYAVHKTRELW